MTQEATPHTKPCVFRIFTGLWIAALMLAFMPDARAESMYEQNFNDATIQLLDGAQFGPDASGASGKPGDKSYLAETSALPKAVALIPTGSIPAGVQLDELTVTAWYKPSGDQNDATTLFSALGSVLIWDSAKKQWVWRVEVAKTDGSTGPYWFYLSSPPAGEWLKPGEWTFIVLTWSRNESLARFYQGDSSTAPVLGREMVRKEQVDSLAIDGKKKNTIGNDRSKTERAFGGEIDNVRFYDKALDEDAIAAIYKADLANEPVK